MRCLGDDDDDDDDRDHETGVRELARARTHAKARRELSPNAAMRLGPIILSWVTATAGWLGQCGSTVATPRSRDYELSTEFFLVPSEIAVAHGHGLASVASVISVPAPNRTITVFRNTPPGRKGQVEREVEMRPTTPRFLLKQQPWALPLAALSAAAMLLMAGFEVFVLLKVGSVFVSPVCKNYCTFAYSCVCVRVCMSFERSREFFLLILEMFSNGDSINLHGSFIRVEISAEFWRFSRDISLFSRAHPPESSISRDS